MVAASRFCLLAMGTDDFTGVARIELAFPESRSGALTIVLSAVSCNRENRTLITRVSDGLPAIERHYSAALGTRTRTSPEGLLAV